MFKHIRVDHKELTECLIPVDQAVAFLQTVLSQNQAILDCNSRIAALLTTTHLSVKNQLPSSMYRHDFSNASEQTIDVDIHRWIVAGTPRRLTDAQINEAIRQFKIKGRMLSEEEIDVIIQSMK